MKVGISVGGTGVSVEVGVGSGVKVLVAVAVGLRVGVEVKARVSKGRKEVGEESRIEGVPIKGGTGVELEKPTAEREAQARAMTVPARIKARTATSTI